jgi:parallel beta-helix repeat protein
MKTILSLALLCFLKPAFATTYYFSNNSGNDSRTSAQARNPSTPWKTTDKLNSFFINLKPGDQVLFKRGEIFYGSIIVRKSGTSGSPIVIGAYGTGNRPVIIGLTTLSKWVAVGNGIYESYNSSLGTRVNMVLLNDVQKGLGRYPNKGYLTLESHVGKTSITDNQLSSTPKWNNAELVLRSSPWTLDRFKITSHKGKKIYYAAHKGAYNARDNYGYFIQNHIKTLNQLGEWCYNSSSKKLSMFFGSDAPSKYVVKAAAITTLIYSSGKSHIVFDNLTLKGANNEGVNINGGSNMTIKNCDVLFSGIDGVDASGKNFKLENSQVLNANNNGVDCSGGSGHQVRNNIIKNTYYIAGMGQSGNGMGAGIRIGKRGIVEYNQILNSGFLGLQFGGDYTVVRNNLIDTFCFVKDDGGGIYAYTHHRNVTMHGRKVTGNIVLNGIGAAEGTSVRYSSAQGIYMDGNCNGVEIAENTVANCRRGVYLHNSRNITVRNNTLFNNKDGQLHMRHDNLGQSLKYHTITDNIFFSKYEKNVVSSINTRGGNSEISAIGRFDNNVYARPIDNTGLFLLRHICMPHVKRELFVTCQIGNQPMVKIGHRNYPLKHLPLTLMTISNLYSMQAVSKKLFL